MSIDAQREFLREVINNFRAQYSRLIRISYSEEVTNLERIRAIFAACQIKKEAVEIMDRFGYLSRQRLEEAERKGNGSSWDPHSNPLIRIVDKLLPQQRERLQEFLKSEPGYPVENYYTLII